ncbi:MAG: hypothetical protein MI810_10980 [Flavobacteriales bacterium]|jgi:hypothetical protein|nr:hypothetical protein [Flavobacteriales bacterium]
MVVEKEIELVKFGSGFVKESFDRMMQNRKALRSKKDGFKEHSKSGLHKHYDAKFKTLPPDELAILKAQIRTAAKKGRRNRLFLFWSLISLLTSVFILLFS